MPLGPSAGDAARVPCHLDYAESPGAPKIQAPGSGVLEPIVTFSENL